MQLQTDRVKDISVHTPPTFLIRFGNSYYLTTSVWKLDVGEDNSPSSAALSEAFSRAEGIDHAEAVFVDGMNIAASQHVVCASQHVTAVPGQA